MTGVNPGFVMSRLPLLAASASRHVTRLTAACRIDTARREELAALSGRGLSLDEFAAAVAAGALGARGPSPAPTCSPTPSAGPITTWVRRSSR